MIWLLICLTIKKLSPVVTEIFIRGWKLNVSLVFIVQFYFAIPEDIRLNSTDYFIMKIPIKQELQQIIFNHSWDIDLKNFMNFHKKCTERAYSFLVIDTAFASDNPQRFQNILLERIWKY